jgi:hypothetical protein
MNKFFSEFLSDNVVLLDRQECFENGLEQTYIKALVNDNPNYTVEYLMEVTNFSRSTICRYLKRINFQELTQEQIKEISLNLEKNKTCEWCNELTSTIEEHHYPIPKRNGGIEVVKICPNCHSNFHKVETSRNKGWVK